MYPEIAAAAAQHERLGAIYNSAELVRREVLSSARAWQDSLLSRATAGFDLADVIRTVSAKKISRNLLLHMQRVLNT